nr:hypothetical protein [Tanacetum cinerariifolium]
MQGIWGEIERRDPNPKTCPTDIAAYNKIRSENKLFQFLNALDRNYDPIKKEILRWDPLPTAEAAYAAVRKEIAHQNILGGTQQGMTSGVKLTDDLDGIGLVSKGRRSNQKFNSSSSRIDKTKLKCENCGMTKHTKEQCFEIVGYPDWWVGNKKRKSGKAAAAMGSQETIDSGSGSNTHQKSIGDIRTGKIIGHGTERQGLYYVDEVVTQQGTVMLAHGSTDGEAWLWHRRLGHPSISYLHRLFPKLFPTNKVLNCETYVLAKSHRHTFKSNDTKGEKDYNDALSWLKWMSSSTETSHTSLPQSTDLRYSTTNDDLSILISKSNVWREAVKTEMDALSKNDTMERCNLFHGKNSRMSLDLYYKIQARWNYRKKKAKLADNGRYQRIVRKLIYLSHTCPNISYEVGVVSQFMHQPQISYTKAVLRIIRYLKGTPGHGVLFKANGHLETQVYTNADWAGDKGNQRSTSGYFTFIGGNLLTQRSKKQNVVPSQVLK